MLMGVGPWPWSVPTGRIAVSLLLKASSASIHDMSHSLCFMITSFQDAVDPEHF
jgi:hypothetical protein